MVIRHLHHCESTYQKTAPINEVYRGQTVWEGDVEVFSVDHPKTRTCYAWSFNDDSGNEQIVAVLKVPPVVLPLHAVKAFIVSRAKKGAS